MDFAESARAQAFRARLETFIGRFVLPYNAAWQQSANAGIWPAFVDDLKELAREEGLWNLCLPHLDTADPGTRLSNLEYAPLAEVMGRIPWCAEVFNCNAPDSGNMELLQLSATAQQRERWLKPLLAGEIRSAFAMSEPDVASSDPTNLQTVVRREGGELVLNGRKWFITGAAHPRCRLLVVMCRNEDADETPSRHGRHSLVLVPADAPGVSLERNISIMHHLSPEGHCEILLREVRVPECHLLGPWGGAFALAQARLGPGRVHHCMRTIGQCELALALACDRALERHSFGRHLADQSNVQDWIAQSRLEIDQARLLVLRAAWSLDQPQPPADVRAQIAGIKVVAARLQTQVVDRAMQVFGAMGLSPDTPLAWLWTWGRALRFMDGPDEVHLRTVARAELERARGQRGAWSAYFTTPEQLAAPPRIR
ncbi:acyl-CoA dehydrogenase [Caenimonas sedimenti]|uniref:Acyl-CoA dehydrogenase n=1 Tax=Caenimonas sedimenti TaxID=2596921 RepID=A0A562ZWM4_9BURK|nr:acyl-CoA dehydrogenase family protein [Caenimonas sedimenti]TWO72718.1 acyl-CoA dehydrogenase [Caenimonas sedimenti]